MSHDVIIVAPEKYTRKRFGEVIREILGSIHTGKEDQISLNPVTNGKKSNIHVAGAGGGLASICHGCGGIIVLINKGGSFLWND